MVTMVGVASAVRELYLDKFQPQKRRGRRLHALSPNVLIRRLDPAVTAQYINALNEPISEEEDWLAAEEPDVVSENDIDNGPSTSAPANSKRGGRKRKQSGGDGAGKRKRNAKMVGNLRIKEEQPDPDEVSSSTLPMTFLPTTNYSQDPLASTPSDTMALRATRNPRIKQEPVENIIVMPFNTEEEATAAQGGRSKKSLKELTQYLLELNNKNLQCEERMKKFREEFEQRMINVETEKKQNEMEIDKVLGQIQGWKDRLVSGDRSTPPDSPASSSSSSTSKRKGNVSPSSIVDLTNNPIVRGNKVRRPLSRKYWAIRAVEAGHTKEQVMAKYGIPPSTLNDWLRHKGSIKHSYESMNDPS